MYRNAKSSLVSSLAALIAVSGLSLCACYTATAVTDDSLEETGAEITETASASPAATTVNTEPSESRDTRASVSAVSITTGTSEESSGSAAGNGSDFSAPSETEIGYGSFGFQRGNIRFHSQNDISMMIEPEDTTIYDYGARSIPCHWIDAFYMEDAFDMAAFDYSYRFLSFYNDDTSISFSGYKEIGTWQTPKGSELEIYLAEITIISDNLEIRILPKYPDEPEKYSVSVNGRGYYVSEDQLQMADFILSALAEDPGTDPLEEIVSGDGHTYYF